MSQEQQSLFREEGKYIFMAKCLTGVICRYHGRRVSRCNKLIRELEMQGYRIIASCPEQLGGLPVPRPPSYWIKGRLYANGDLTKEVTHFFVAGANKALAICRRYNIKKAYMVKNSPSCGKMGITTKLFQKHGIECIEIWR